MEKYFNPKTKRNQDLFEIDSLCPVFEVIYKTPNESTVSIIVEAKDEEEAIDKSILNQEFIGHIDGTFDKENDLDVRTPTGLYVIGRVNYYDGGSKL